jgi:O-acetylserine/cysteine efflux transporter
MSPKDLLLALIVVVVWGVNFVVIKVGLHGIPPMLLGALRFALVAFPAVFFIKRPAVSWRWIFAYGLTISFGQFALLFYAMSVGMPAGLASMVLQTQAFFTLIFASMFLGERLRAANVAGLLLAACGLTVIALQGGHAMTLAGFLLTVAASSMWGAGNIVTKRMGRVDLLSLVVWASLIPPLPFLALSFMLEGRERIVTSLAEISWLSIAMIVYLSVISTMIGYTLWGKLFARYPASQVAPFSLLVPVVGLASAALLLGEGLSPMQLAGALLVMAGLAVNVFGGWIVQRFRSAVIR